MLSIQFCEAIQKNKKKDCKLARMLINRAKELRPPNDESNWKCQHYYRFYYQHEALSHQLCRNARKNIPDCLF